MAAAARTLEGRWRLRPLVSASHCVWEDRREPWEQGGQVVLGGCGHRLCWLMGDVRALEGIGFLPPPAALSRSAVFQRDPITISLQSQGRGRSRGDRRELPAGQRGPFKPPPLSYTCSRSSEIWGLVWETVRTSERSPPGLCGASGFESALRRADVFDLQQGLARPRGSMASADSTSTVHRRGSPLCAVTC